MTLEQLQWIPIIGMIFCFYGMFTKREPNIMLTDDNSYLISNALMHGATTAIALCIFL